MALFPSTAAHVLHRIFTTWIRIALPCRCTLCETLSPEPVCSGCMRAYWPSLSTQRARCIRCAYPLDDNSCLISKGVLLCGQCLSAPPAFDATVALADYAAPLDMLVHALKFKSRLALASIFAQQLAIHVPPAFINASMTRPDFIIPVPLSKHRLIMRGYNQAWEIARPLARALGLRAHPTLLARVIDTPPQQSLSVKARHRNMRRAFSVPPVQRGHVRGCHIAVVDDVMTSGATLHAIARTLKRAGAARVTNWVILRTPK